MRRGLRANRSVRPPVWRVSISLLLIALILYNPFSGLCKSSNHLSFDARARHRANLGAGELQHFSPVSKQLTPVDLDVDTKDAPPAASLQEYRIGKEQQELLPVEPAPLAGVWFRPPPSR